MKTKRYVTNDQQAVDQHKVLVAELYAEQQVPFMERGTYCIGHVAVESDGELMAFASLFFNPAMRWKEERAVCIGNLEMKSNPEAVRLLLEEVEKWGADYGAGYLIGPMNGSTWGSYRFPLDNSKEAFFTEQLRKDEYPQLLEGAGMERISTYFSAIADCQPGKISTAEADQLIRDMGLYWTDIDLTIKEHSFAEIHNFCQDAFSANVLYTPIDEADFVDRYARIGTLMIARYILVARDQKNKVVGLLFAVPNHYCETELQLVVKTLAVDERYRKKGLASALGAIFMNRASSDGCTRVFHAYIQSENNSTILSEKYEGEVYRTYGLWAKQMKQYL